MQLLLQETDFAATLKTFKTIIEKIIDSFILQHLNFNY